MPMERGPSDTPNNESWSTSDGESDSKREKDNKGKKKAIKPNLFASSDVGLETDGKPPKAEATIWQRSTPEESTEATQDQTDEVKNNEPEEDKKETVENVELTERPEEVTDEQSVAAVGEQTEQGPEQPIEQVAEAQADQSPETSEGESWVDEFAESPVVERQENPETPAEAPAVEQDSLPPGTEPQRRTFWTENEIRTAHQTEQEHDILPPPLPPTSPTSGENAPFESPEPQPTPTLAQAVNPNVVIQQHLVAQEAAEQQRIPTPPQRRRESSGFGLGALTATAAYFLGRRRGRRAERARQASRSTTPSTVPRPTGVHETARPAQHPYTPGLRDQLPRPIAGENANSQPRQALPRHETSPVQASHEQPSVAPTAHEHGRDVSPRPPERTMRRAELLALAKAIRVDGISVHDMYTARRIDEDGLHRVVSEYLRGGDVKQAIAQEVRRQQIKFERDPHLRGAPIESSESRGAARSAARIKDQAKDLLDLKRAKERTERLSERMYHEITKVREAVESNPNIAKTASVLAVVVIYAAILIIMLT